MRVKRRGVEGWREGEAESCERRSSTHSTQSYPRLLKASDVFSRAGKEVYTEAGREGEGLGGGRREEGGWRRMNDRSWWVCNVLVVVRPGSE